MLFHSETVIEWGPDPVGKGDVDGQSGCELFQKADHTALVYEARLPFLTPSGLLSCFKGCSSRYLSA